MQPMEAVRRSRRPKRPARVLSDSDGGTDAAPPARPPPPTLDGTDPPPAWVALLRPPAASEFVPPPRAKGVTRHTVTQRHEAHLWDSSAHRPAGGGGAATTTTAQRAPDAAAGPPKPAKARARGRQVYLGGFSTPAAAARAYDIARIAYRGWAALGDGASLNYPLADYAPHAAAICGVPREAVVAALKRASAGFSRGASVFRGVGAAPAGAPGKWEARVGRVAGARYTHIGYYATELEAARAYDEAVLALKGAAAITNFPAAEYESPRLPASAQPGTPIPRRRRKRAHVGPPPPLPPPRAASNGDSWPGLAQAAGGVPSLDAGLPPPPPPSLPPLRLRAAPASLDAPPLPASFDVRSSLRRFLSSLSSQSVDGPRAYTPATPSTPLVSGVGRGGSGGASDGRSGALWRLATPPKW